MTYQIEVGDGGITITHTTEPVVSMYGKVMRPGGSSTYELPWDEIAGVTLATLDVPGIGERWITMEVDLTWGEFFELPQDSEGFDEAVVQLSRRSGEDPPDLDALGAEVLTLWAPRPTV